MERRMLGRSQIQVSAIGLGTNTIGGPVWDRSVRETLPIGYGDVDTKEALRAIRHALSLGITFFDTADEYGCGQSERLLGEALTGKRDQVVIATKFGVTFDEASREITGSEASPTYIRRACEASLQRLRTDFIDLYQFHLRDYPLERAGEVRQTLEELAGDGKIQHRLNILIDNPTLLGLCDQYDLASINRIPLLMGVLTGKFTTDTTLPEKDIRKEYFKHSSFSDDLKRIEKLKTTLIAKGHTLPQASLAWILTRHPRTIPIPGFRNARQVEENAKTLDHGLLSQKQMSQVEEILGRQSEA
jgi:aryl-alcohol dehydrogenase-like predicted oxidoreductase